MPGLRNANLRFVVMNLKNNPSAGLCAFLQHPSAALAQAWRSRRVGFYRGWDLARFLWRERGMFIQGVGYGVRVTMQRGISWGEEEGKAMSW